jgi:hypothetical protein
MNTLLRGLLRHVYMDQADAGAASGGSGTQAANTETAGTEDGASDQAGNTSSGGAGTTGNDAGSAAGNEAGGNVLAGAQSESAQTAQVQEKYLVKNEDGTTDWEATAQKQAQGYDALSKRMGSGDAPPKTAEEYVINVPDELKEALGDLKADPQMQEFLKDAHAVGLSQKQLDAAIKHHVDALKGLTGGIQQLNAEDCVASLKETWKNDAEYTAGLSNAHKAATAFFGEDAQQIIDRYGNDPALIRGLAKMGAELGEDKPINPEGALTGGQSIDELMSSEAYSNPKHADHARVSKQVQDYFNRLSAQQEKAGNAPIL